MPQPLTLNCPPSMRSHVQSVLAGEYDTPYDNPAAVVLDVGANIGSFATWATRRWPGSFIHCYEPLPENFAALKANLALLSGRVALNNWAIGDPGRRKLFLGRNNCGEGSFFDLGEQRSEWVEVEAKAPASLPKAHVLKLDTEGAEIEILSGLPEITFDIVLLEYHSEANRRAADCLLHDYALVGGHVRCLDRGVLKYAHRRLIEWPPRQ